MSSSPPSSRNEPRTSPERIAEQVRKIAGWQDMGGILDAIPDILVAINSTRQIVFANRAALDFFKAGDGTLLWGQRPGEAAGCVHHAEMPGGCGDAEACKVCGVFRAASIGLGGNSAIEECRMLVERSNAFDLRVWARPFQCAGEQFTFLSIRDISDEKRRLALEKIFFHDLLNTAGGIRSVGEVMGFSPPEQQSELHSIIVALSEQLVDEISAQRELLAAERGEIDVESRPLSSLRMVERIVSFYSRHSACGSKRLAATDGCSDEPFRSDPVLLARVLGNLVKNALEASPAGCQVTIGCRLTSDSQLEFSVHNEGVIPRSAQIQIFNRSFSTKGRGRGLGTYSVKLLTERFLRGSVRFVSTASDGTTFLVTVPLSRDLPPADSLPPESSRPLSALEA